MKLRDLGAIVMASTLGIGGVAFAGEQHKVPGYAEYCLYDGRVPGYSVSVFAAPSNNNTYNFTPERVTAEITIKLTPDAAHRTEFLHRRFRTRPYLVADDERGNGAYESIEVCEDLEKPRFTKKGRPQNCIPLEKDSLERARALIDRAVARVMTPENEDCDYSSVLEIGLDMLKDELSEKDKRLIRKLIR